MASLTAKQINSIPAARKFAAQFTTTREANQIDAKCAQIMVEGYQVDCRQSWSDPEEGTWTERPATRFDVQDYARRVGKSFDVCLRALLIASPVEKATRKAPAVLAEFREFVGEQV